MKCPICNGTGKSLTYTVLERHVNGTWEQIERTVTCTYCQGTGSVMTSAELVAEIEAQRVDSLGKK